MLKLAIDAGIPIIEVETTDVVNIEEVLDSLTGKDFRPFAGTDPMKHEYSYHIGNVKQPKLEAVYSMLVQPKTRGVSLVIVNPEKPSPTAFWVGPIPSPTKLIKSLISEVVEAEEVDRLMPFLSGMTLKEVGEIARITMTRDGSLTPDGIVRSKGHYGTGTKGLTQVNTSFDFYAPPKYLLDWVELDGQFFHNSPSKALQPRGLLFGGPPGTGKTLGAKYIAKRLDVPLYRLDISGMQGKYVGDSETALANALARIDNEAPCVVLIDEVEKVFGDGPDSGGVKYSMLGQLLWWLQEHTSNVLTIMTTNNHKVLPPELYREGRIDKTISFEGLSYDEANEFAKGLIKSMGVVPDLHVELDPQIEKITPAHITQLVLIATKKQLLDKTN